MDTQVGGNGWRIAHHRRNADILLIQRPAVSMHTVLVKRLPVVGGDCDDAQVLRARGDRPSSGGDDPDGGLRAAGRLEAYPSLLDYDLEQVVAGREREPERERRKKDRQQ